MPKFNSKTFNAEAFGQYVDLIPKTKKNELLKSGALRGNEQIKKAFEGQSGVVYATIPMYGRIGGTPLNYDGMTDIEAETSDTFERSVVVIGRSMAWEELDFSEDVTGGAGFMDNVANQVSDFWEDVDQDTLLSIMKGIFSMSGNVGNTEFVKKHTYDVNEPVNAVSLNNAAQQASGDNKNAFTLIIMHSQVATTLENMKVLKYLTYTDTNGIERELQIASWNGRAVLIDDSMPAKQVNVPAHYVISESYAARALEVVADDTASPEPNQIKLAEVDLEGVVIGDYVRLVPERTDTKYTSYVLGQGAFDHEDIGVEVPYEMDRDPKVKGGKDILYSRQRKVFAPYGISFTKKNMATNSPTNTELEDGQNWELVHNGGSGGAKKYIDHKAIPIVQLKTLA